MLAVNDIRTHQKRHYSICNFVPIYSHWVTLWTKQKIISAKWYAYNSTINRTDTHICNYCDVFIFSFLVFSWYCRLNQMDCRSWAHSTCWTRTHTRTYASANRWNQMNITLLSLFFQCFLRIYNSSTLLLMSSFDGMGLARISLALISLPLFDSFGAMCIHIFNLQPVECDGHSIVSILYSMCTVTFCLFFKTEKSLKMQMISLCERLKRQNQIVVNARSHFSPHFL